MNRIASPGIETVVPRIREVSPPQISARDSQRDRYLRACRDLLEDAVTFIGRLRLRCAVRSYNGA